MNAKKSYIIQKKNSRGKNKYVLYERLYESYRKYGYIKDISILPEEHPLQKNIFRGNVIDFCPNSKNSGQVIRPDCFIEMDFNEVYPYINFCKGITYNLIDTSVGKNLFTHYIPNGIDHIRIDSLRTFGVKMIMVDARMSANAVNHVLMCIEWSFFKVCEFFGALPHEAGLYGYMPCLSLALSDDAYTDGKAYQNPAAGIMEMCFAKNAEKFDETQFKRTFFHEWGHLLDSYIETRFLNMQKDWPKMTDCEEYIPEFCREFVKSILYTKSGNKTKYYKECTMIDNTVFGGKGYYNSPSEIFARAIEEQFAVRYSLAPESERYFLFKSPLYKKTEIFIEKLSTQGIFPQKRISIEEYYDATHADRIAFLKNIEKKAEHSSVLCDEDGFCDSEREFSFVLAFNEKYNYLNSNKFYISGLEEYDLPDQIFRVAAFLFVFNASFKDIQSVEIRAGDDEYEGLESIEAVEDTMQSMFRVFEERNAD